MQTYFPPTINFSKISTPINGALYATFTFSLVFALDNRIQMPDDFPFLLTEENPHSTVLNPSSAWASFISSIDKESFLDFGIPKLYSEWLMAGSAYGRGQKAVSVNVNVGTLSREILVVGNSHDAGIDMIDPTPFEKMPLTWANTYGGKAHIENPSGKGIDKDSFGIVHLPNVYEKSTIGHNTQKIPACPQGKHALTKGFHSQFGFQAFPNGLGTYDDAWVKNMFPSPPKDFDWKYYNLAQAPQMMQTPSSQGAVFKPLENIRITNMNEFFPELIGQIPPYNVRFFIEYDHEPQINIDKKIPHIAKDLPKQTGTWREINTQLDTLWLLPNQNMGVLMWHASAPTQSESHIDFINLAAYLEYTLTPQKDARECIAIAIAQEEGVEVKADIPKAETQEKEDAQLDLKTPQVALATTVVAGAALADAVAPDTALADELQKQADKEAKEQALAEEEMQALTKESIASSLAATTETLANMGVEVAISPEEVEAKMAELSAQLDALLENAPQEPTPEEILANTSLSPEQIEAVKQATEIEFPYEGDFENIADYNKAFEAYATEVALLMGAPTSTVSSIMDKVSALDTLQNTLAEKAELAQTDLPLKILTDAGLPESDAQALINALQIPLPEDDSQESLMAYFENFDKSLNYSDASTASSGNEKINQLRALLYGAGQESMLAQLSEANIVIPEDQEKAFEIFKTQLKEVSFTNPLPPDTDLAGLAVACGVTSPALLSEIYAVDSMPIKAPAPEVPTPEIIAPHIAEVPPEEVAPPEVALEKEEPEPYKTPTNAEEFKQALIDEIDLTSHDLSGIDLSNLDISMLSSSSLALCAQLSLEGANLENAKIMKANFSKTQLTGANLTGADFSECDLTGTSLAKSSIKNTIFDKAILDKAIFDESIISQSSFIACSASDSSWNRVQMEACAFKDANLTESSWIESTLTSQDMSNACFSHASFEMSNMEACQFHGDLTRFYIQDSTLKQVNFDAAQLMTARFYTSKFIDTTFQKANLSKSNWSLVSTEQTNMEKALLDNAVFEECSFRFLQAPYISAQHANFQSCDLTGANLNYINLFQGSLRDCLVADTQIANANLYEADLYLIRPSANTNFDNTDLTNTILTRG